MKYINNLLVDKKIFLKIILTLLSLSCMTSHNSHVFLYLNGLNLCIKHLDMSWNIWNLISWRKAGNKQSICYDDSKCGSFILEQSG